MCGRFFLRPSLDEILRYFDASVEDVEAITHPRWNIAPTQDILACTQDPLAGRRLAWRRWGLVPSWWKQAPLSTFINARAETVADKPAFRAAYKRRRCLIPASGFYEWTGATGHKQAWAISPTEGLFAFAGVHEVWRRGETPIASTAILTRPSVGPMATVHDRMPVVIPPDAFDRWLDPRTAPEDLTALLHTEPPPLAIRQVGAAVGNVRHSDGSWFGEDA